MMTFDENLPLYSIVINEEEGIEVDKVSIVKNPAMESNFLMFSKNYSSMKFTTNEEKQELLGVALIPDLPIYRNMDGKEFYVVFTKETIKQIAQNLFKKGYHSKMNVEHSNEDAESYIYQSFIVDKSLGINAPSGFENTPDGSWFIGVKVESESLWEDIKSGKRNGFSVEGLFQMSLIEDKFDFPIIEEEEDTIDEENVREFIDMIDKLGELMDKM